MMISGILPICKESNCTSFDVVRQIKKLLKFSKVGHLGTLDPMATGVLLITVNKATKLFDLMQKKTKTYNATFKFGVLTDTLDITGTVIKDTTNIPSLTEIQQVISKFIGHINQVPPKYSAKNINGIRAYDLARKNVEFEIEPKMVYINKIKIEKYVPPFIELTIECGSGTYIRALGRDIANELNTYATMTSLTRTSIDNFNLNFCYKIEDLSSENILNKIIPINEVLDYPILDIDNALKTKILNGQIIDCIQPDGLYKLNENNLTQAIVKVEKNKAKMSIYLS